MRWSREATHDDAAALAGMVDVMRGISVLKRVRRAGEARSGAERLFLSSWSALLLDRTEGAAVGDVAVAATAAGLAGARLGPLDITTMAGLGIPGRQRAGILSRALAESGPALTARFAAGLEYAWPAIAPPGFARALCEQPRAGATRPGHHRVVLLPAESHADHCLLVAIGGVLLAEHFGADPGRVFLAGLAHHLHNARLPDAGYQGEMLLGEALAPLMDRLFAAELATLPPWLATHTRAALAAIGDAATPEGRAFHAADVLDRVLQVHHHAAVAGFRAEHALSDMELVHPGPVQSFHLDVLRRAGLA